MTICTYKYTGCVWQSIKLIDFFLQWGILCDWPYREPNLLCCRGHPELPEALNHTDEHKNFPQVYPRMSFLLLTHRRGIQENYTPAMTKRCLHFRNRFFLILRESHSLVWFPQNSIPWRAKKFLPKFIKPRQISTFDNF